MLSSLVSEIQNYRCCPFSKESVRGIKKPGLNSSTEPVCVMQSKHSKFAKTISVHVFFQQSFSTKFQSKRKERKISKSNVKQK